MALPAPAPAARPATRRADPAPGRLVLPLAGLLGDGHAGLGAVYDRLRRRGTPPAAAATYLAAWFAGGVAEVVGLGLATRAGGLLVDPETVAWEVHPSGWPERVDLPLRAVVPEGHPWAGREGVEVARPAEVVRRTVAALVTGCTPVVEGCLVLAAVAPARLWDEVGDGLGSALSSPSPLPPNHAGRALLEAALHAAGVPWQARPRLGCSSIRAGVVWLERAGDLRTRPP